MLLNKHIDEAHPDWNKPANISFYNGLTSDIHVTKCSGSVRTLNLLSHVAGKFDKAYH